MGNPAISALQCCCNGDCKLVATLLADDGGMTETPTTTRRTFPGTVSRRDRRPAELLADLEAARAD
jgi:hypothetical protein